MVRFLQIFLVDDCCVTYRLETWNKPRSLQQHVTTTKGPNLRLMVISYYYLNKRYNMTILIRVKQKSYKFIIQSFSIDLRYNMLNR